MSLLDPIKPNPNTLGSEAPSKGIDVGLLHTTPLGEERIRRNLSLAADDVVEWCKDAVRECYATESLIERRGKNWYVAGGNFVLTINAHSHTIITAHKK